MIQSRFILSNEIELEIHSSSELEIDCLKITSQRFFGYQAHDTKEGELYSVVRLRVYSSFN